MPCAVDNHKIYVGNVQKDLFRTTSKILLIKYQISHTHKNRNLESTIGKKDKPTI